MYYESYTATNWYDTFATNITRYKKKFPSFCCCFFYADFVYLFVWWFFCLLCRANFSSCISAVITWFRLSVGIQYVCGFACVFIHFIFFSLRCCLLLLCAYQQTFCSRITLANNQCTNTVNYHRMHTGEWKRRENERRKKKQFENKSATHGIRSHSPDRFVVLYRDCTWTGPDLFHPTSVNNHCFSRRFRAYTFEARSLWVIARVQVLYPFLHFICDFFVFSVLLHVFYSG